MTTTIEPDELEARIEQLEVANDELSDKVRELTDERDGLRQENVALTEKVDEAKDLVNELARGLNQ